MADAFGEAQYRCPSKVVSGYKELESSWWKWWKRVLINHDRSEELEVTGQHKTELYTKGMLFSQ
jgi:hypothetical protein